MAIMFNTRFDYRAATGSLIYKPGTLLLKEGNQTVHVVDYRNKLRTFSSMEQFIALGFKNENVIRVPKEVMDQYGTEGIDPADGLGNGQWGTKITADDPYIPAGPASMAAPNNTKMYLIAGAVIIGGFLIWKYRAKIKSKLK